jgi:hypothetical protein
MKVTIQVEDLTLTAERVENGNKPWATTIVDEVVADGDTKKADLKLTDWELGAVTALAIGGESDHGMEDSTVEDLQSICDPIFEQLPKNLRIIP